MKLLRCLPLAFVVALVFVSAAFADNGTHTSPTQVLSQAQLWCVIIGILSPLVGYVVNSAAFKNATGNIPEPLLAFVHVAIAAIGAAIYELVQTNSFGWNDPTLQLVLSSVIAAFAAHGFIWKPSGVAPRLARHQAPRDA